MDLTEAETIKKRWQKYTEELYKKVLNDPDNHHAVITHIESDIQRCEIKWTLENTTLNEVSGGYGILAKLWTLENTTLNEVSGGYGILAKLFKILKDDAVKLLHSVCQHIWKTQQWPQD